MKKLLHLIGCSLLMATAAQAQCDFMIPSTGYVQITSNQTLDATGQVYWVCAGVTLDLSSSTGAVFLLEQDAILNINASDGDEVYAKAGCVVNNNSSAGIGMTLNVSNVTTNNNGSGFFITTMTCPLVTFNYLLVGGDQGCATVGIDEAIEQNVQLYPNPVNQNTALTIQNAPANLNDVTVYNSVGMMVKKLSNFAGTIDVTGLVPGHYFVVLRGDNATARAAFVVTEK